MRYDVDIFFHSWICSTLVDAGLSKVKYAKETLGKWRMEEPTGGYNGNSNPQANQPRHM